MSAGKRAFEIAAASPVAGWVKPSSRACSAWRGNAAIPRADRPEAGDRAAGARAVDRVADQRMADMRQMHADLVRAAGQQPAFEQTAAPGLPKRRSTR